ncbi:hypothetical protein SAMN05421788_10648 [Filimonas lacunae]|uniref:Uncharacterized protein n=2 Tax=Filimonas lacunae TaxID=477680 RepID=A0A1N7QMF2_9BACT|nr:hypothetical protein SAMN05421788_10648 [Filimonas lacunae]
MLVHCVTASSFPEGVRQAHETLHALVPNVDRRNYFGLSRRDEKGIILYKAGVTALDKGELDRFQLETICLAKGDYLYIDVPDFMKNRPGIGQAFEQLIADERMAADGFCIEWYLSLGLCRCMVRMK